MEILVLVEFYCSWLIRNRDWSYFASALALWSRRLLAVAGAWVSQVGGVVLGSPR
jgi:hypothetical protein